MNEKMDLNRLTQPQFAALLGRTVRTIQRNPHLEKLRHGSGQGCYYVWSEFWAWLNPNLSPDGDGGDDRKRKDRADADLAELKRDQVAGSLVDRAGAVRAWGAYLGRLKQNLLGYGGRVAPRLVDGQTLAERQDVLDREMRASLRELVAEAQRLEDEP